MFNANNILKTKYFTSLKSVLPDTPVFKNYVPNQFLTDNYILISGIQNTEAGGISKHKIKSLINISIYTRASENDGLTMDQIADAIFSLYPTPQDYPIIPGYQVCSVRRENDNELVVSLGSGEIYLTRQIIFSHILNKLN